MYIRSDINETKILLNSNLRITGFPHNIIITLIQEKTGNKKATSHIIQAISMTVQRGNATSIMGTRGPLRKLEDLRRGIIN